MTDAFELSFPLGGEELAAATSRSLFLGGGEYDARPVTAGAARGTAYVAGGLRLGPDLDAVVSIGAFDGVHLGHRALVGSAVADARERGCACVVVTFDPDPSDVLRGPADSGRLLSTEDRVRALMGLGPDAVVVLRFDEALAATSYRSYLEEVLPAVARVVSVHVGSNFRFGAGGEGDVAALSSYGRAHGFDVHAHELVALDGSAVSSTRVRGLLHEGRVEGAARLLDRLHFVRGAVEHGRGEGTSFGFPTANVRVPRQTCMPAEGVYAGIVCDGRTAWPAAINVGAPPTFAPDDPAFLEANLIGFSGDLYGMQVAVLFARWLRASRPFDSVDELERVVLGNIDWVRKNLGASGMGVRS